MPRARVASTKGWIGHAVDLHPFIASDAEAARDRVLNRRLRKADDAELVAIECFNAGDGQPADRMDLERTGQQTHGQRAVRVGAVGEDGWALRGTTAEQSCIAASMDRPVTRSE